MRLLPPSLRRPLAALLTAPLVVSSPACLDPHGPGVDPAADDASAGPDLRVPDEPNRPDEPANPTPEPAPEPTPTLVLPGPHANLPTCTPQASGFIAPAPPELPADLFDTCGLQHVRATGDAHVMHTEVDIRREGDTWIINHRRNDGRYGEKLTATFHAAAAGARPVLASLEKRVVNTYYENAPATTIETWRWDTAGRIVAYTEDHPGFRNRQASWDRDARGQLLHHTFVETGANHQGQDRRVDIQWRHEGSRLAEASQQVRWSDGQGLDEHVRYTYDTGLRIASIARTVAGQGTHQDAIRHAFAWRGDNDLAERSLQFHAAAIPADLLHRWLDARVPFDDFEVDVPWMGDFGYRDPATRANDPARFHEALWRIRDDGSCNLPPRLPGHAWPEDEGAYELGLRIADTGNNLGWAYGYSGYAYGYGHEGWFGHEGIGVASWPLGVRDWLAHGEASVRIAYDAAQRMKREEIALGGPSGGRFERVRTFDDTQTGHVVGDEILNAVHLATDTITFMSIDHTRNPGTRVLAWDNGYPGSGAGLTRSLSVDGRVVGRQTWHIRAAAEGAVDVEHAVHVLESTSVFHHGGLSWDSPPDAAAMPADDAPMRLVSLQEARFDPTGAVLAWALDWGTNDDAISRIDWVRDAEGRPLERTSSYGPNAPSWRTTWRWDAAGRPLHEASFGPEAGAGPESESIWQRDDDGRTRAHQRRDANGLMREAWSYRCD